MVSVNAFYTAVSIPAAANAEVPSFTAIATRIARNSFRIDDTAGLVGRAKAFIPSTKR